MGFGQGDVTSLQLDVSFRQRRENRIGSFLSQGDTLENICISAIRFSN